MSEIDNCCGTTCDKPVAKAEYEAQVAKAAELDKMLSARVSRCGDIEAVLLNMANGKLPLPNQQDCRVMALRLGTPKKEWSEIVKNWQWAGFAVSAAPSQKAAEYKAFIEDLMANMGAGATYDEIGDMLANWWERENGV